MKTKQDELISKLYKYAKEFDENLANNRIMIICENDKKTIEIEEIFFPISIFYHLTGVKAFDRNKKEYNATKFYKDVLNSTINSKRIYIKDNTTNLKLEILKDLIYIDKNAKMIGDYSASNIYLQTNKLVGNVYACMGLVKSNENREYYIPNTALKEDIRKIASNKRKIIAILKRKINEKTYNNITYLKRGYDLKDIINQLGLKDVIEVMQCNIK